MGTRRNLADYLRSRTPYMVNPLIAGFDTETGKPELYFMDYLAAMIQTKYACHGYGGFFSTSIMDRHHRTDMTRQQAYALMVECVKEVQKRLVLNLPNFGVVVGDKEGIHNLDTITPEVIAKHAAPRSGIYVFGDSQTTPVCHIQPGVDKTMSKCFINMPSKIETLPSLVNPVLVNFGKSRRS